MKKNHHKIRVDSGDDKKGSQLLSSSFYIFLSQSQHSARTKWLSWSITCEVCEYQASTKEYLQQHIRSKHEETSDEETSENNSDEKELENSESSDTKRRRSSSKFGQ